MAQGSTPAMTTPDRIHAAITDLLAEAGVRGAAIAVIRPGHPALTLGIGRRGLAGTRPMAADARTYAYSLTKTWIAAAAARLAADGRLDLDAPARGWLPEVDIDTAITLRHLLGHTAGLPDYGPDRSYHDAVRAHPGRPWSRTEFLDRTLPAGPLWPPGKGWAYSNVGYLLVREIVVAASGRSFAAALDALVFRPAGMNATQVVTGFPAGLTPGWSGYLASRSAPVDAARAYHPGWVAHGVAVTTALDAARSLDALFAGAIVPPALVAELARPVHTFDDHPIFRQPAYGLGLMLDLASPWGVLAGHAGEGPGYSTAAFRFPDLGGRPATIAALANGEAPDLGIRCVLAAAHVLADCGDR